MNPDRIRTVKLPAFREGWRRRFGAEPSESACVLGISVALHETSAGDAWPNEHNWGATTLRALRPHEQWILATDALRRIIDAGLGSRGDRLWFNRFKYSWQVMSSQEPDVSAMQRDLGVKVDGRVGPQTMAALYEQYPGVDPALYWPQVKFSLPLNTEELKAVAPIHPSVGKGHAERAKEAMRVLTVGLKNTGVELPRGAIHCDSTPENGAYFVWFAAFPNDADGAEYFVGLVAKTQAERDALESSDPHRLAEAMYSAGYYTGFNDPDQPGGRERNIAAYSVDISKHMQSVRLALAAETT